MSSPTHDHQEPQAGWNGYSTNPVSPMEPQDPDPHGGHGTERRGHGPHKWMLLLCAPLVLIGLWSLATGGGGAGLLGGLVCMGLMAFMHLGMGGKEHRH
ncbi:MAG: hypothetical protein KIT69_11265 [Propionibacteriaceae bacterium]|nr:hypothetical protein [Propionibacteriaceae bacterium]